MVGKIEGLGKALVLVALTVLVLNLTAATSIGTAPGTQNIGELEPGSSYELHFYITTRGIDSSFTIEPEFRSASTSDFERSYDGSGFNPEEASQQPKEDWVEFDQDTYNVNPVNENVASLDNGGSVVYNEQVSYTIDLPEDAETGYHRGSVNLNPNIEEEGVGGSSVMNLGLTQYNFYFRVPGYAERDLRIMDVRSVRTGEDSARFDFIVENNGTVTTQVRRSDTTVFDELGEESGEVSTGGQLIEPGQQEIISTYWRDSTVDGGEYRVRGDMNYITGRSIVDETISISERIEVEETDDSDDESQISIWLVLMTLIVLGALMYSFKIDPIIIAVVIMMIGISIFVMMTELPSYLIGILVVMTIASLYYGI